MATLTLTTKTSSYGVLASLPTANVSTMCIAINPVFYTAAVGTLSPSVATGQMLIVKVTIQCAVGATVRTLRLMNTGLTTVLATFAPASCPADPNATVIAYSARVIVGNTADWVDAKLQVSSSVAGDTVQLNANTLVIAFAEKCNIIDERLIRRNVSNIYFLSMQATQESILGKIGAPSAIAFGTVPVNGLSFGFEWSTNSGNTLYSWDGSSIGISP